LLGERAGVVGVDRHVQGGHGQGAEGPRVAERSRRGLVQIVEQHDDLVAGPGRRHRPGTQGRSGAGGLVSTGGLAGLGRRLAA